MHAFDGQTDRQTDGQTEISSQDRVCIPCSAVKNQKFRLNQSTHGGVIITSYGFLKMAAIQSVFNLSKKQWGSSADGEGFGKRHGEGAMQI